MAKSAARKLQSAADSMNAQANAFVSQAKDAKNGLEQLGVDIGINAAQMGTDMVAGIFTGGNNLIPKTLRTFGGAAQTARQEGASLRQQTAYGTTSAVSNAVIEKAFDGLSGFYGKSFADNLGKSFQKQLREKTFKQKLAEAARNDIKEGAFESFATDLADQLLQSAYKEKGMNRDAVKTEWDRVAHIMLVNTIISVLSGDAVWGTGEN